MTTKQKRVKTIDTKTETAVLTNEGIDVVLAGKTYHIKPLPIGRDMAWRNHLADVLGRMTAELAGLGVVDLDETGNAKIEVEKHITKLLPMVIGSTVDDFFTLMFLYAPELQKDREAILESCTEDELIDAGIKIFGLAAGRVKKILSRTEDIMNAMVGVLD